jgi:hypothetical protein
VGPSLHSLFATFELGDLRKLLVVFVLRNIYAIGLLVVSSHVISWFLVG